MCAIVGEQLLVSACWGCSCCSPQRGEAAVLTRPHWSWPLERVEISTVETMPHLTTFYDRSFLADHSMVSFKRVRRGWLHIGHSSVGEKSFVGNSATVGPDRQVPGRSLVAVLSSAPDEFQAGSSWFGLPPAQPARPVDTSDSSRTYNPDPRLVAAGVRSKPAGFCRRSLPAGWAWQLSIFSCPCTCSRA